MKTEARGVSAHYDYDALNRIKRRWYNGSSSTSATNHSSTLPNGVAQTDEVTYAYDSGCASCNTKGRLISVASSVSTYSFGEYDALGSVKAASQTIGEQTYTMSYNYDLAGHVVSMTYPSGRTVTYAYDGAGRTSSFIGNLGGADRNYATGMVYSPFGGTTKEQFGTDIPIFNNRAYNSRGQLAEIRAGTSFTGPTDDRNRGQLINWYSSGCGGANCNSTDNNGNLRKQETFIPHNDSISASTYWNQVFDYDNLNRLHSIQEGAMRQEYVYDRFGNRTIHQTQTVGAPKPNFGVDPNTNRLTPRLVPQQSVTTMPAT